MELHLFLSALVLGAISSFHCVGMCGVFAFSIPTQHFSPGKKVLGILLYNFGRITTYAMLGLLFGLLGRQIFFAGLQQWFAIISGIAILLICFQGLLKKPGFHLPGYRTATKLISKLIGKYLGKPSLAAIYLFGAANGLLPCGLVYLAITGALAIGTVTGAAGFMGSFGLGTLPAMFLLSYSKFFISISVRNKMRQLVPLFAATMAVMLILRGMNLNIPYISPVLSTGKNVVSCN